MNVSLKPLACRQIDESQEPKAVPELVDKDGDEVDLAA
jgi:hypothetical protein